jgi:hypothetical protein
MGHSVVRTESQQNHFHSSEISPKRGTTFSRQRQFTSNKINELIHVRQRKVLKMGLSSPPSFLAEQGWHLGNFDAAPIIWSGMMSIGVASFGANAQAAALKQ